MTAVATPDTDISVLDQLDFEPRCEIFHVNEMGREVRCDKAAKWAVTLHCENCHKTAALLMCDTCKEWFMDKEKPTGCAACKGNIPPRVLGIMPLRP